jgi:hypothetical protein
MTQVSIYKLSIKNYLQELLIVLDDNDMLFHVSTDDTSTTDCDFDGFIQNSPSQGLHLARKRSTEHDRLPIWASIVEYAHNLRLTEDYKNVLAEKLRKWKVPEVQIPCQTFDQLHPKRCTLLA